MTEKITKSWIENEPADNYCAYKLSDFDHGYITAERVEAFFKTNFKDYDNFRIEKIAEYEKEETDRLLSSIDGLKDFIEDRETRW